MSKKFVQLAFESTYTSADRPNSLINAHIRPTGQIQFRSGRDPIFVRPGLPPAAAKTGDVVESPVIFNLDLIHDPRQFSYGDAVALWIHEHGHKVKNKIPSVTQQEIDEVGARVKDLFDFLARIYDFSSVSLLVLNPIPPNLEGQLSLTPYSLWPMRISPTVAMITPEGLVDLTVELESGLDQFGGRTYREIQRHILHVLPRKAESDGSLNLHFDIRTTRFPKNEKEYLLTDIGPNHFTSADVRLLGSRVEVSRYRVEPPPPPLVTDALADVTDVQQSSDGSIIGRVRFDMENTQHFFAQGYPTSTVTLLTLFNGEPRRLEAQVRWHMSDGDLGLMPAEAYKKKTKVFGRFSLEDKLGPGELEIVGVVARFFTYGGFTADEQRRVQLKEARSLTLSCESVLLSRP